MASYPWEGPLLNASKEKVTEVKFARSDTFAVESFAAPLLNHFLFGSYLMLISFPRQQTFSVRGQIVNAWAIWTMQIYVNISRK